MVRVSMLVKNSFTYFFSCNSLFFCHPERAKDLLKHTLRHALAHLDSSLLHVVEDPSLRSG